MHLLLPLFALSGWAGLGYQVLWSKYLLGFIGVSALSYAAVLSVFMGGLALGSRYLGQALDRVSNPLKFYGILEFFLGVYTILFFEPLLDFMGQLYLGVSGDLESSWMLIGLRVILAAFTLLFPTFLMGGTYPAVLKASLAADSQIARNSALLYGINALGAALGSLGMAFLVLPTYGLAASLQIMGILNLVLALWAMLISRSTPQTPKSSSPLSSTSLDSLDLTAFLCGFFTFSLEIGWTRFFSLSLGSTTYSFALVIATFIAGIGLGGLLASRIQVSARSLGYCLIGSGLWIFLTLPFHPYFPLFFKILSQALQPTLPAYWLYESGKMVLTTVLMLPTATLCGMVLPLLIAQKSQKITSIGRDSGRIYAINTLGNVLGAWVSAIFLLPFLMLQNLLALCALGLGVLGLTQLKPGLGQRKVPLILLLLGVGVGAFQRWDTLLFSVVPTRLGHHTSPAEVLKTATANRKLLFQSDDPSTSVLVIESTNKEGGSRSLYVNGKIDASDAGDLDTQILLAQLPVMMHPEPKSALVIGYGSGVTAGSILLHPLNHLDVVELSSGVIESSRFFSHINHTPLQDSRTRLHHDDAQAFLKGTNTKWDMIISEPSNPWIAGIGGLFTQELYQIAASRLNPGGIFCQWLQQYEISGETVSIILATLRSVFPQLIVFQKDTDLIILASQKPLTFQKQNFLEEEFKSINIPNPEALLMLQVLTNEDSAIFASTAPLFNTADNLYLEYQAPKELFLRKRFQISPLHNSGILMSPNHLLTSVPTSTLTSHLDQTESHLENIIAKSLLDAGLFTPKAKSPLQFPDPKPSLYLKHLQEAFQISSTAEIERLLTSVLPRILIESRFLPQEQKIWWEGLIKLAENHPGKSNFLHFLVANLARERGQNEVLRSQILATRAPYTGAIGPRLILLSRHSAPDLLPGLIQKMGDGEQAGIQALFSELHALEELESIYRSIGKNHVRTGPHETE